MVKWNVFIPVFVNSGERDQTALACNFYKYDAYLCIRNVVLLACYLNFAYGFVSQYLIKCSTVYLVYSVPFDCTAANVANYTSMVGLTALE